MVGTSDTRRRAAWAFAALLATGCLAYIVSQAIAATNLPDDGTDAYGMYMLSTVVVGGMLLALICVFLRLAFRHKKLVPRTPPPAGWYADPHLPHRSRYWDGAGWTEQLR